MIWVLRMISMMRRMRFEWTSYVDRMVSLFVGILVGAILRITNRWLSF